MLELKNITKIYQTGAFKQEALKDINLKFRKSEFVSILGKSGSGKTTFLNIIGGLDKYTSGDLIINGKSTKGFKDSNWDSYRNNSVGFIFQSYNLINHINILNNVEMSMTLSGISKKKRKELALKALDEVGLKDHAHKKPNQLSGGQMQRVAIARALANDPDIILADEPTGALDSKTSEQIMNLIKKISKNKLVIMVTHNKDLANKYSERIINLKDGEVISDTNPYKEEKEDNKYKFKKTSMSFLTALKLSLNNIFTKKGRTILTAFASSIGIIGISLILALSNGFDVQVNKFESDTLSSFPVLITAQSANTDIEEIGKQEQKLIDRASKNKDTVYSYDITKETVMHTNKITKDYIKYINNIDKTSVSALSYIRMIGMNLITKDKDIKMIDTSKFSFTSLPKEYNNDNYMEESYDMVYGTMPKDKYDLVLEIDSKNRVDINILKALGIENESTNAKELIGKQIKLVFNNDYYKNINNFYTINTDLENMYEKGITLTITGVMKSKEGNGLAKTKEMMNATSVGGLYYNEDLINVVIENNSNSEIVKSQEKSDINVLTGQTIDEQTKNSLLTYLGKSDLPVGVLIFPKDFDSKGEVLKYLDRYNKTLSNDDKILYTDLAATMVNLSSGIMDAITIVLIAFSAISLIVSCIMIGIITYISVLERTKEIGILRALGARKKDITRVFNAETFIIGLSSGLMGVGIAFLLLIPTNIILLKLTNLENVARMNPVHIIIMVSISVLITLIGGFIPSKIASKKSPVEALRTE